MFSIFKSSKESGRIETSGSCVEFVVQRSRKRQSVSIRIDPNGAVIVFAPVSVKFPVLEAIILKKISWINKHVTRIVTKQMSKSDILFVPGDELLFMGQSFPLVLSQKPNSKRVKCFLESGTIQLEVPDALASADRFESIRKAMIKLYKKEADFLITERAEIFAEKYGFKNFEIKIKEQKKIWGSCSSSGVIRMNWKLIMAPLEIIDYVVVHELCHLKVPNHSKKFWDLVGTIIPEHKERRKFLRHATALYSF